MSRRSETPLNSSGNDTSSFPKVTACVTSGHVRQERATYTDSPCTTALTSLYLNAKMENSVFRTTAPQPWGQGLPCSPSHLQPSPALRPPGGFVIQSNHHCTQQSQSRDLDTSRLFPQRLREHEHRRQTSSGVQLQRPSQNKHRYITAERSFYLKHAFNGYFLNSTVV